MFLGQPTTHAELERMKTEARDRGFKAGQENMRERAAAAYTAIGRPEAGKMGEFTRPYLAILTLPVWEESTEPKGIGA